MVFIIQEEGNKMLKIKIITKDLDIQEQQKIELARQHIERIVNSILFKEYVLNYSFTINECTGRLWWKKCSIKTYNKFWSTDLTNKQVYDTIMKGKESLSNEGDDEEADIFLEIDRRYSRNVIGYTNPSTPWQFVYNWFFGKSSIQELAGNLFHEWLHKIGFDHDFKYNDYRPFSVPYALGDYIERQPYKPLNYL